MRVSLVPPRGARVSSRWRVAARWLRHSFVARCVHMYQFVEERAIVDHGGPQFFRAGFAFAQPQYDVVRRAIVFHHSRMIDRDVGRTLIEISDRIATRL